MGKFVSFQEEFDDIIGLNAENLKKVIDEIAIIIQKYKIDEQIGIPSISISSFLFSSIASLGGLFNNLKFIYSDIEKEIIKH